MSFLLWFLVGQSVCAHSFVSSCFGVLRICCSERLPSVTLSYLQLPSVTSSYLQIPSVTTEQHMTEPRTHEGRTPTDPYERLLDEDVMDMDVPDADIVFLNISIDTCLGISGNQAAMSYAAAVSSPFGNIIQQILKELTNYEDKLPPSHQSSTPQYICAILPRERDHP